MQIVKIDKKENNFEVIPDSFDDLWHLERLISQGDLVSGSSDRKIKPKNEGEKAFKEKVFVEIETEKVIFHEAGEQLRVQGIVTQAKPEELVPLKSHHTIEIETGRKIKVVKKELKKFHIERLERAKEATGKESCLIIVMDDEGADFASIRDTGIDMKTRIFANKEGKRFEKKEKANNYFKEVLEKIMEIKPEKMIIAGPGFEKQNFEKFLKENHFSGQTVFESTNSVGITGINELVKSGKVDKVIAGFHSAEEAKAVEKILEAMAKEMAAIGIMEVKKAVETGAAEEIAVEEKMVMENKEGIESILDLAEKMGTKIRFVNGNSDAGKKLIGIGGIAATLRYKTNY